MLPKYTSFIRLYVYKMRGKKFSRSLQPTIQPFKQPTNQPTIHPTNQPTIMHICNENWKMDKEEL